MSAINHVVHSFHDLKRKLIQIYSPVLFIKISSVTWNFDKGGDATFPRLQFPICAMPMSVSDHTADVEKGLMNLTVCIVGLLMTQFIYQLVAGKENVVVYDV